ncbi:hypothetical protein F4777DRAFT_491469 [Nemania sp. FL0916]|nr:hypothetical protein F4777DRAFT_491469 [Nemania sp. FL0916]
MSAPLLRSLFEGLSLASSCSHPLRRSTRSLVPTAASARPLVASSHITQPPQSQWLQSRSFHVSVAPQAKPMASGKGGGKSAGGGRKLSKRKKKGSRGDAPEPRIVNLKSSMSRAVPAPLRFARNRALRHWTIHRAWQLFLRKERERQELELERMWQSMRGACEALRNTSGPGTRGEGALYRIAMLKHGVYGHNAVPIEYARPQTETPARKAWNHEWTR